MRSFIARYWSAIVNWQAARMLPPLNGKFYVATCRHHETPASLLVFASVDGFRALTMLQDSGWSRHRGEWRCPECATGRRG